MQGKPGNRENTEPDNKNDEENMNLTLSSLHAVLRGLMGLCMVLCVTSGKVDAQEKRVEPVEAWIYSTMPSTSAHRPEMALDGDQKTYFKSAYGMDDGDAFLILFSRPISVQSLRIITGDSEGQDALTEGAVETSPDAVQFSKAAAFDNMGIANATPGDKPIQAFRIRLNPDK